MVMIDVDTSNQSYQISVIVPINLFVILRDQCACVWGIGTCWGNSLYFSIYIILAKNNRRPFDKFQSIWMIFNKLASLNTFPIITIWGKMCFNILFVFWNSLFKKRRKICNNSNNSVMYLNPSPVVFDMSEMSCAVFITAISVSDSVAVFLMSKMGK